MEITKIKPKTNFSEAFIKITLNFAPLYEELDERIVHMEELVKKRFKKGKDKAIIEEFIVILSAEKALFQTVEEHSKFIYGIRDIVAEYGNAIEKLSEHVEALAKESTNKKLTDRIIREHVDLKDDLKKVERKADDARNEIEDFDKLLDNLAKKFSKDKDDKDG